MVGDMLALQYTYGANTSWHAGADTYGWQLGEKFLETLWDGGGVDTINGSNQTLACVINLTPGSYSSIGLRQTHAELYQDIPSFAAASVAASSGPRSRRSRPSNASAPETSAITGVRLYSRCIAAGS
jgi:hypothetical protein